MAVRHLIEDFPVDAVRLAVDAMRTGTIQSRRVDMAEALVDIISYALYFKIGHDHGDFPTPVSSVMPGLSGATAPISAEDDAAMLGALEKQLSMIPKKKPKAPAKKGTKKGAKESVVEEPTQWIIPPEILLRWALRLLTRLAGL